MFSSWSLLRFDVVVVRGIVPRCAFVSFVCSCMTCRPRFVSRTTNSPFSFCCCCRFLFCEFVRATQVSRDAFKLNSCVVSLYRCPNDREPLVRAPCGRSHRSPLVFHFFSISSGCDSCKRRICIERRNVDCHPTRAS